MRTTFVAFVALFLAACGRVADTDGTWSQVCIVYNGTQGSQNTIAMSGGNYTLTNKNALTDQTCTQVSFTVTIKGIYSLGDSIPNPSGAKKVNFTLNSFAITPNDSTTVAGFNSTARCGLTNWALNVSQDVTGKTC